MDRFDELAAELGYTKAAFHRLVHGAGIEPKNVQSTFSRGPNAGFQTDPRGTTHSVVWPVMSAIRS